MQTGQSLGDAKLGLTAIEVGGHLRAWREEAGGGGLAMVLAANQVVVGGAIVGGCPWHPVVLHTCALQQQTCTPHHARPEGHVESRVHTGDGGGGRGGGRHF